MPDVDWDFIAEREQAGGKAVTTAYVPKDAAGKVLGKSGVTVGTGFDIGQRSAADIDKLDLSAGLKTKLKDFALLKGDKAVTALADYKKTNIKDFALTEAEVQELDLVPKKKDFETLKTNYNLAVATAGGTQLQMLPAGIQTAIASVAMQYGPGLNTAGPKFWKNVTDQDWAAAVKELENFDKVYISRHKLEADKMREGIKELPAVADVAPMTTTSAGGAATSGP